MHEQDPCYEVRVQFVQKLHKGLLALRLPLQYMGVLCLGALDPLKERRAIVKQMFVANVTRRREYLKQNLTANSQYANCSRINYFSIVWHKWWNSSFI